MDLYLKKRISFCVKKNLTIVVVTIDYDETKTKGNLEIAVLRICCHRFLCWGFVFTDFCAEDLFSQVLVLRICFHRFSQV